MAVRSKIGQRLLREVVAAVREEWQHPHPLFVRVSATDWASGGWDIDECVQLARWLKSAGVDLIDVSSRRIGAVRADTHGDPATKYRLQHVSATRRIF